MDIMDVVCRLIFTVVMVISCLSQVCDGTDLGLGEACTESSECSDKGAICNSTCICQSNRYDNNGFSTGGACMDVLKLRVDIVFSAITTVGFIVSWTPPNDKLQHIDEYTLKWQSFDNKVVAGDTVTLARNVTSFNISSNITAGRAYSVSITSRNRQTQYDVDRVTVMYRQQAAQPRKPGPLTRNTDISISDNSITITWIVPNTNVSVASGYTAVILDGTVVKENKTVRKASATFSFSTILYGYRYTIWITTNSQRAGGDYVVLSETYKEEIKTLVIEPNEPTSFRCAALSNEYVDLAWLPPPIPNGDIVQYHIEVYNDNYTLIATHNTVNASTSFRVTGLTPGTYYRFGIFTENEKYNSSKRIFAVPLCLTKERHLGLGEACTESSECSDKGAICNSTCICQSNRYDNNGFSTGGACMDVLKLRVDIVFSAITTVGFIVSWTPPNDKLQHIDEYTLKWQSFDNKVVAGDTVTLARNVTSFNISSNITAGRAYSVSITSRNRQTQYDVDRVTVMYRQQAAQPRKPGPLTRNTDISISDNSITITWIVPNTNVSVASGYTAVILDGTVVKENKTVLKASATFSFSTILYGYRYTIWITTNSQRAAGGNVVLSETYKEEIKTLVIEPNVPTSFRCAALSNEYVDLAWFPPPIPNGDIVQYHIEVYNDNYTLIATHNTVNASTSFRVTGLTPGTYYRFGIFTENEKYNSSKRIFAVPLCLTKERLSDPPQNLLISDLSSRSMTISWEEPNNTYSEDILGYVLQIRTRNNDCVLERRHMCSDCTKHIETALGGLCPTNASLEIPKTKLQLTGRQTFMADTLLPSVQYTVSVTAINGVGRGHAAEANQTTNEDEKDPISNTTVTTVIAVLGCVVFVAVVVIAAVWYYRRRLSTVMKNNGISAGKKTESTQGNKVPANNCGEVSGRCTNPDNLIGSDGYDSINLDCMSDVANSSEEYVNRGPVSLDILS